MLVCFGLIYVFVNSKFFHKKKAWNCPNNLILLYYLGQLTESSYEIQAYVDVKIVLLALGYLALGNLALGDRKIRKRYKPKLYDAAIYDLAIAEKSNLLKMILRIPTFCI